MKKWLIGSGIFIALLVGAMTVIAGPSPRDWWGLVRYAAPRMHKGDLKVGDAAPDGVLVALDGQAPVSISSRLNGKPLVLVFGSFT
jgi:hypothetical protein